MQTFESPPMANGDPAVAEVRREPYSLEAEQAVLGGLLLSDDAYDRVADRLDEDDFFIKDHRLIYAAISGLYRDSRPRDALTVAEQLKTEGHADGMMVHLAELSQAASSAANIAAYAVSYTYLTLPTICSV